MRKVNKLLSVLAASLGSLSLGSSASAGGVEDLVFGLLHSMSTYKSNQETKELSKTPQERLSEYKEKHPETTNANEEPDWTKGELVSRKVTVNGAEIKGDTAKKLSQELEDMVKNLQAINNDGTEVDNKISILEEELSSLNSDMDSLELKYEQTLVEIKQKQRKAKDVQEKLNELKSEKKKLSDHKTNYVNKINYVKERNSGVGALFDDMHKPLGKHKADPNIVTYSTYTAT